ncbi:MAG: ImmA/IrrE family metallo-endopeptidase [Candidatus Thiodiazotropha sp. (ex Lucinoma borealis)]|nr:ImmA/IrrE family metallo-endopeptidase [Candidatus Thiodiazotropha sp. (ex Lucinoma borealis)]
MPKINHQILVWARNQASLSPDEACSALKLSDGKKETALEKLAGYETGTKEPSRAMLREMARTYRRPILTFYLNDAPNKVDRGEDLRTLAGALDAKLEYHVSVLIRDIKARQSIVRQILLDEDEAEPHNFIGGYTIKDNISKVVQGLRSLLGIDLTEYRRQSNYDDAFKLLRNAVENLGVFVVLKGNLGSYHTDIDLTIFRGFALCDDIAPFIVINHKEAKSARAFTLIHELAHLLIGKTGISGTETELEIEKFCDSVASEFLLPEEEIAQFTAESYSFDDIQKNISFYAQYRRISRTQVAYRLLARGVITNQVFRQLKTHYLKLWRENQDREKEKNRSKDGGPSANVIRRSYLGGLVRFVQRMNDAGAISTTKAGVVLGVKPLKVNKLFEPAVLA